jgi:hypothetical protein
VRQASGCADGWESSSPPNIETISRFGDIKITLIELEGTGLKVERVYYPIIIGGLIARICSRLSRLRPMFPAKTASCCLQSEPPGNPLPVCCPLSLQSGAFPRILANPLSPPSDPVQRRLQSPPAKSNFLAVGTRDRPEVRRRTLAQLHLHRRSWYFPRDQDLLFN